MTESDQIAHHTFAPWKVKGETRVVASEAAWRRVAKWNRDAEGTLEAWESQDEFGRMTMQKPSRPRVLVDVDVFEDWRGPMSDVAGKTMFQCCQCQTPWAADVSDYDPTRRDSRIICQRCKSPGPNDMTIADVRRRLFSLIDATPNLDWLITTKHPEKIGRMMPQVIRTPLARLAEPVTTFSTQFVGEVVPHPNLWLGASCEDQATADERIPHLLKVSAAVRFLSCEPLLGPVDFIRPMPSEDRVALGRGHPAEIDWVIVGCESGHSRRPMEQAWAEDIARQCEAAGVAFFMKQMLIDNKVSGDIETFPQPLQARRFPNVR